MTNKVPDAIRQSANSVDLISFWSPSDPDVGRRLAHFSMATAWSQVGNLFNDEDRYAELDQTFQFALSLRRRWDRMSRLPTSLLGDQMDEIALAAVSLANKIEANLPELALALGDLSLPQSIQLAQTARSYATHLKSRYETAELQLRPTKPGAASAEATYCVKALTTLLLVKTGETNNSAVGEIVGALLDLRDRQLSADLVAKLTKGLWLPV